MQFQQVSKFASLKRLISGPQTIAFAPAICLCAYWFGGEAALAVTALLFPMVLLALSFEGLSGSRAAPTDGLTGLPLVDAIEQQMTTILNARATTGRTTACLVLEVENFEGLKSSFGDEAGDKLLVQVAQRLSGTLREHDMVARVQDAQFAISLAPIRQADLESMIQVASRLQAALHEPFSVFNHKVYASTSVGFCMPSRAPEQTGAALFDAATAALNDAIHHGPGAIRAYSRADIAAKKTRSIDADAICFALENGQIIPWFQPQVSTDTGEVTGMEALARWEHPESGPMAPQKFLPTIKELGQIERLGEIIRFHAFAALREWDALGLHVPTVSVNFTADELSNPKLVEKLGWELDRHELAPERLDVEILEDVIAASQDDVVPRNIRALKELGCHIDLDDFGTGYASISNVRRFCVDRIKIDRSYVTRCDVDREQQDMLAAILTMAERLNIASLAEGVETLGEHAMLAQLGCGFVQGYSIARPMRKEQVPEWITRHKEKLAAPPEIGRQTG